MSHAPIETDSAIYKREMAKARYDAIDRLRLYDIHISQTTIVEKVLPHITACGIVPRVGESRLSVLRRFIAAPVDRQIAEPRQPSKFRPLTMVRHPRQDEIDAHPRPMGMHGVGNSLNLGGGH